MKNKLKVCWISAGVSSFVAGYLERDSIDKFIYIDIDNQHQDSMRFIKDCEKLLDKKVDILKSPYGNVQNVIRQFRYVCGVGGGEVHSSIEKTSS